MPQACGASDATGGSSAPSAASSAAWLCGYSTLIFASPAPRVVVLGELDHHARPAAPAAVAFLSGCRCSALTSGLCRQGPAASRDMPGGVGVTKRTYRQR